MKIFPRNTPIALACAAILAGFAATPSVAGVIAPAEKETLEAPDSPLELIWWRRGWHHRHHHWACHHRWVVATDYPEYVWRPHPRNYYGYYVVTPAYYVVYPTWGWDGWGWGGGGLLGGLFGFL
jgi:hypothetical protein